MDFESSQGIYRLGIAGGSATVTVASGSGFALQSDASDGAADGRLYLRNYGALDTADATALKASNFDVFFDGSASATLPRLAFQLSGALAPKLFTASPVKKDDPPPLPAPTEILEPETPDLPASPTKVTLLDMVVSRLRGHGRPAHEVWLPPLEESPAVNELLPVSKWDAPENQNGRLWMPMGLIDRPYDQRQDVLAVDKDPVLVNR